MSKPAHMIALAAALALAPSIEAEDAKPMTPTWRSEKVETWQGYQRHHFTIDGCKAWVAVPTKPLPGNQWAWSMEFPEYFIKETAGPQLLEQGFYYVHIQVGNTFGSPDALKHLDAFHTFFTHNGLAKKGTLIGLSRGGMYAYNWGHRNTDKVVCIYGDAPVCDFKSWPAGKGKGKGSKSDWALLQKCYGFKDEAEALAWTHNPVDCLEPLAKAGIPLIHVVGDADAVVPPTENTAIIEARYKKLGGEMTVFHKPGVGHHPHGLEDITPVVDLIVGYTRGRE